LPEWLTQGGRIIWVIMFGGMILLAVWRIASEIFKYMRRRATQAGGEVESLKGAFRLDLINWLKRIISRIFGIKFGNQNREKVKNIPPEIASVRHLYRELLRWAEEGGLPRKKEQTPSEFQYVLNAAITDKQEALDFITHEYLSARYGAELPSEEKLERMKRQWQDLKQAEFKKPDRKNAENRGK
jgi:hypothetical protein